MYNENGSTESTGESASKILKFEELLVKANEEMKQAIVTFNEYKLANKILQHESAKKELTSLSTVGDYKRVELEVQHLKAEKKMPSTITEKLDLKSSSNGVRGSLTKHKVLETV